MLALVHAEIKPKPNQGKERIGICIIYYVFAKDG